MSGLLDTNHILQTGGLVALAAIIFAESGLLIGFFLPGDTLLIPAGILASQHRFPSLYITIPVVAICAIAGYQMGYSIGRQAGPRFFKRKGGFLFRADYIPRTEALVERHGGKAMIIARFVAVVRTIVPVMAGIGKMNRRKFMAYNVAGALIWVSSLTMASYWVGKRVANIDKFIVPIVALGIITTAGGELWFIMRNAQSRHGFAKALREELGYIFKR